MTSKSEKKIFGIAEFETEEKWLGEQHQNGWSLVKTNKYRYEFEKCEPQEWIYQLDFVDKDSLDDTYHQIFMDCGWELVLQSGRWCYFRKKKVDGEDLSIFSDRFSRLDLYTRMLKSRQLILSLVLFSLASVVIGLTIFTRVFHGNSFWQAATPWIGIGLYVATSFSVHQSIKLSKMTKNLR